MLCNTLMKKDVELVFSDDTVQTAACKMRDSNVGFLPVCEPGTNKVIGTITDRDIAIRLVADCRDAGTRIEEVMTNEVVSCRPYDDVKRAEQLMQKERKSRIMCIDDKGELVGVISLSDIAHYSDPPRASETLKKVTQREVHHA